MTRKYIYARREPFILQTSFLFHVTEDNGDLYRGMPITLRKVNKEEHGMVTEPTFSLPDEAAQFLMDDLWTCGFRPAEGTGSAGALAATQKHLEDMRRLVFSGKGKPE